MPVQRNVEVPGYDLSVDSEKDGMKARVQVLVLMEHGPRSSSPCVTSLADRYHRHHHRLLTRDSVPKLNWSVRHADKSRMAVARMRLLCRIAE